MVSNSKTFLKIMCQNVLQARTYQLFWHNYMLQQLMIGCINLLFSFINFFAPIFTLNYFQICDFTIFLLTLANFKLIRVNATIISLKFIQTTINICSYLYGYLKFHLKMTVFLLILGWANAQEKHGKGQIKISGG